MSNQTNPAEDSVTRLTKSTILETLAVGEMQEDHGLLPWGSNYAYLMSVSAEQHSLIAVYKPQRGERPLWDFPDGTLCYREVAAFVVSEMLGWDIVPPTVLRGGPYGLGSVQFYIEHDPQLNYFSPFPVDVEAQLQRIVVFDYLTNNADRKGSHCLLDAQGHLWGIDHGLTFHYAPKLRTVIWDYANDKLPTAISNDLTMLCGELQQPEHDGSNLLHQLLAEREVIAVQHRAEHLLKTNRFPLPGAGPNYPWPPV